MKRLSLFFFLIFSMSCTAAPVTTTTFPTQSGVSSGRGSNQSMDLHQATAGRPRATAWTTGTPEFLSGVRIISLTATPGATASATAAPGAIEWFTMEQNANCRKGPNTFYDVVKILLVGQRLEASGRDNDLRSFENMPWLLVRLPGMTERCWVTSASGHLDGAAAALPKETWPALPDSPAHFSLSFVCPEKGHHRRVEISWAGVAQITGYLLYRATDDGQETVLASLPADATSFQDDVNTGNSYTYELASTNEVGASQRVGGWMDRCK